MKNVIICLFLLFLSSISFAQEKVTLSGVVTDQNSGEKILGANVFVLNNDLGTVTNDYGYYSLDLKPGKYEIEISYIGYETQVVEIEIKDKKRLDFELRVSNYMLDEVEVVANSNVANIRRPQMSVNTMSVNTIKAMPVVLGEVDVIKSLIQLPGVSNAGEGASGFNVRGGAADQNLILLDGATLYSSSHLFGFFSIFNPDAIRNIKLYKGGIPAKYGSRVSSVLDIYQKDGNSNKFHLTGGIGVISSRLLAEGPIVKGKSSFLVGGRSSYAHLFLKLTDDYKDNSAYFYDLNTKLNYKINKMNTLYLSGYFGRDVFRLNDDLENIFGNSLVNLRWNHLFSDKLFSNLSLIYSDYYYGLELGFVGFEWESSIKNFNLKYDFNHYLNHKLTLNYGVQGIYYDFHPGKISPSNETSTIKEKEIANKYAIEGGAYLDIEHKLSEKLALTYGLRFSYFAKIGAENINLYTDNKPVVFDTAQQIYEKATPIGEESFDSNEVIKGYNDLEPRISLAYAFNDNNSIKASYNRMAQYMHLISNTSAPTPLDVWTPSGKYIKPQLVDLYAIGYAKNFLDDTYSLEVESYYKKLKNRLDYIDGADLVGNEAIEQVILSAEGRAYGLECYFRKNKGRLTGWASYTLSRAEQRVKPRNDLETGINNGEWYRANYDKTHDLTVTGMYRLNKKWSFSASFTLQSGMPTTYPKNKYIYGDITIPNYGLRNEEQLPAYHRLDISATFSPATHKNKRWKGEWVFGIYNLYNRMNAQSITFRQDTETGKNEAVKLSIFGIVPSVTYNFKF
ncbi:outer membrane receptor protein involved in Fe transport [Balneicella halophila]|uniref:Outer membrane receptor protein involved in Fe transport n=1 Tax=Balneicella halophila TaxID=1537566 RepID=A0A7L4URD5_BALHA|nr:TonB-dependent receptor [Balneicella halophila]PVX52326.1 outer membrane receptor protein involved in Fe transport [Balneicella halophila]